MHFVQFSKYVSPILNGMKDQRYDRPFMAEAFMKNDLVDAGKVGLAGLILGFDALRANKRLF